MHRLIDSSVTPSQTRFAVCAGFALALVVLLGSFAIARISSTPGSQGHGSLDPALRWSAPADGGGFATVGLGCCETYRPPSLTRSAEAVGT